MALPRSLSPFEHRVFRSVWIANVGSNFGALVQTVAAAWMMTTIAQTATMVTLVQAAAALPIMILAPFSGAIADNYDRRKVMLVAQTFMFTASVLLAVAAYAEVVTPWSLLALTFLVGCGVALKNPSWQASVAEMVPKGDLPAAIALNGLGNNVTRGFGPALGGAIVAAFGVAAAFLVNAASYLPLIVVLWRWNAPSRENALPREPMLTAVTAGVRYIALSPHLQSVLLRAFVFGFSVIAVLALLPLLARDRLAGDAFLYGILYAAFGAGAVVGALASGALRERYSNEWSARFAFLGFALCAVILATASSAWLIAVALVLGGTCWLIAFSMFNISVQLSTPRWVVGRALSFHHAAVFGGQALGAWVWGTTAESMGLRTALLIAAGTMVVGAAMGVGKLALPATGTADLDPSNRWREPKVVFDLTQQSGPIMVMIQYRIPDVNTVRFLSLMAERRRIKLRDGARGWALLHDIADGERWTESYRFPSWLEYVRYSRRPTVADNGVADGLKELHAGDAPPHVTRMMQRRFRGAAEQTSPIGSMDPH